MQGRSRSATGPARAEEPVWQKDLVADGPMFKSYTVEGDKVIIEFDNAEGGLVVAETGTNAGRAATRIPPDLPIPRSFRTATTR